MSNTTMFQILSLHQSLISRLAREGDRLDRGGRKAMVLTQFDLKMCN